MLLNCQAVSPVEINRQFDSFDKIIQDLERQAILARYDILMCREITNFKNIIVQIRRNALKGIDPQIDLAPSLPNRNSDSVFCNELNISTIDPPSKRMQKTLEVIEIEDQNLCGSQSNADCITVGGKLRPDFIGVPSGIPAGLRNCWARIKPPLPLFRSNPTLFVLKT